LQHACGRSVGRTVATDRYGQAADHECGDEHCERDAEAEFLDEDELRSLNEGGDRDRWRERG
jgi:hypothetical protein